MGAYCFIVLCSYLVVFHINAIQVKLCSHVVELTFDPITNFKGQILDLSDFSFFPRQLINFLMIFFLARRIHPAMSLAFHLIYHNE